VAQASAIFCIEADLGNEEETIPRQNGLDLILVCHVLEHLYDPAAALARFHNALSPAGHLLLEVPCAIAPDTLLPGWFTFEHLHYYQPAILERLLRQAGFAILETRIDMTAEHYPVIAIAAQKAAPAAGEIASDPNASIAVAEQYVIRDSGLWAATERRLADLSGPVFVYGAGIHTAQLLDRTRLAERAQILAIVDRDSKKWGQTLAGTPVISPDQLFRDERNAPVIISSYVSEHAITRALLAHGMPPSRIKPLYSDLPA
jgi:SAM-dependent methyltransferase